MSAREREFKFTNKDFDYIRRIVSDQTGIVLSDAKRDMVYGRLTRRLRKLGMDSFRNYCELIKGGDGQELVEMINSITTNLTSFFRENHHFEYLINHIIEEKRRAGSKRLRIWSAGCSTGEEPYSIAMTIRENLGSDWDAKILATDLDSNVLAHGRDGVYNIEKINGIPKHMLYRWFYKGKGQNSGMVKVSPELQSLITFNTLNLVDSWSVSGPFDLVFCRNVLIYFSKDTQRIIVDRFADVLDKEGTLFIGHSESLFKVTDRFKAMGYTIYKRVK